METVEGRPEITKDGQEVKEEDENKSEGDGRDARAGTVRMGGRVEEYTKMRKSEKTKSGEGEGDGKQVGGTVSLPLGP